MNPDRLLAHFDRLAEVPDAIPRLRQFIFDLAVRGQLDEGATSRVETTLGELGTWGSGGTPSKSHPEYYGGTIPWLVIGDLNEGMVSKAETHITEAGLKNSSAKILEPGTILIAMYGSIGKLGIAGIRCATNQAIAFCTPKSSMVVHEYLVILLKSIREELLTKGHGVAQQNISQTILKAHPVTLPPLAEQHRIVAKVDELMALCDRLEEAQKERERRRDRLVAASLHWLNDGADSGSLRVHACFYLSHLPLLTIRPDQIPILRRTILNIAVRGHLVLQDPNDEPASQLLKRIQVNEELFIKKGAIQKSKGLTPIDQDDVPTRLPNSWEWVRTEAICEVIVDCPHSTAVFIPSGIVCIDTNSFKDGALIPHKLRYVSEETYRERVQRLVPQSGDVVFAREGSVGASVIIPDGMKCCLGQRVMLFRPMKDVLSTYFSLALSEPSSLARLLALHKGIGAKHVNVADMRNALIPLPPLAEQHRIMAKVDELMAICDQLEAQLTTWQTESRRLLEAVLHEALAPTAREAAASPSVAAIAATPSNRQPTLFDWSR